MNLENDIKEIENWENKIVDDLCIRVDAYCKDYQKIRRLTMQYIKALEKCGLGVESYTIKKESKI